MLKKNIQSAPGSERAKFAGRIWTVPLRTLFSSLAFIALLPAALAGQATSPTPQATPQAAVYGTGTLTPLLFEGEAAPGNQVSLSLGTSAFYDDNVFATNSLRLGDEALSFNSNLGITRQTEHLRASFDYMPFFLLYRRYDKFDRVNHSGNLNLDYKLTPRVIVGVYDTISYQNGAYPSLIGLEITSGPPSPTAPNQMIIAYTTRTLANVAGLDLTFAKSQRTLVTLSGGYSQIKYGSQTAGEPLYNDNGFSGGLQYQYRLTERSSFGVFLLHQDSTYQGGDVFGNRLRSQAESTFLSVGSRLSPTVAVIVFGGPQYVHTIGQMSAAGVLAGHFHPSGGGSITKEVRKTALDLSFQRLVSGGGGLYTSAIYTTATFGVRRRLEGRWEADLQGSAARGNASLFQLANGRTDALIGGVSVSRPLSRGSVFHVSYNTWHQLSKGTLPISSDFDRNQVAVGIDYQLKAIPLGR